MHRGRGPASAPPHCTERGLSLVYVSIEQASTSCGPQPPVCLVHFRGNIWQMLIKAYHCVFYIIKETGSLEKEKGTKDTQNGTKNVFLRSCAISKVKMRHP